MKCRPSNFHFTVLQNIFIYLVQRTMYIEKVEKVYSFQNSIHCKLSQHNLQFPFSSLFIYEGISLEVHSGMIQYLI